MLWVGKRGVNRNNWNFAGGGGGGGMIRHRARVGIDLGGAQGAGGSSEELRDADAGCGMQELGLAGPGLGPGRAGSWELLGAGSREELSELGALRELRAGSSGR
jgi:hypothetical protein